MKLHIQVGYATDLTLMWFDTRSHLPLMTSGTTPIWLNLIPRVTYPWRPPAPHQYGWIWCPELPTPDDLWHHINMTEFDAQSYLPLMTSSTTPIWLNLMPRVTYPWWPLTPHQYDCIWCPELPTPEDLQHHTNMAEFDAQSYQPLMTSGTTPTWLNLMPRVTYPWRPPAPHQYGCIWCPELPTSNDLRHHTQYGCIWCRPPAPHQCDWIWCPELPTPNDFWHHTNMTDFDAQSYLPLMTSGTTHIWLHLMPRVTYPWWPPAPHQYDWIWCPELPTPNDFWHHTYMAAFDAQSYLPLMTSGTTPIWLNLMPRVTYP